MQDEEHVKVHRDTLYAMLWDQVPLCLEAAQHISSIIEPAETCSEFQGPELECQVVYNFLPKRSSVECHCFAENLINVILNMLNSNNTLKSNIIS